MCISNPVYDRGGAQGQAEPGGENSPAFEMPGSAARIRRWCRAAGLDPASLGGGVSEARRQWPPPMDGTAGSRMGLSTIIFFVFLINPINRGGHPTASVNERLAVIFHWRWLAKIPLLKPFFRLG